MSAVIYGGSMTLFADELSTDEMRVIVKYLRTLAAPR
jgi:hypothetical protein